MQPLPLLAPGPADQLGCGRHRGSPPPIHAWLRLPAQVSRIGKSPSPPSCQSLQKKSDVLISACFHLKDLNLCLDLTFFFLPSCSPLPNLKLIQFPSFFSLLKLPMFLLFSLPFLDLFRRFLFVFVFFNFAPLSIPSQSPIQFFLFEPARTLILSGWLFSWSRTVNSTGHWRNSYVASKTGTVHRSSRWFSDGHVFISLLS